MLSVYRFKEFKMATKQTLLEKIAEELVGESKGLSVQRIKKQLMKKHGEQQNHTLRRAFKSGVNNKVLVHITGKGALNGTYKVAKKEAPKKKSSTVSKKAVPKKTPTKKVATAKKKTVTKKAAPKKSTPKKKPAAAAKAKKATPKKKPVKKTKAAAAKKPAAKKTPKKSAAKKAKK